MTSGMTQPITVDAETAASYQAANYYVEDTAVDKTYAVRIGETAPEVARILARHGAETGLIITAWNPHSRELPLHENESRNRALLSDPLVANDAVVVYPSFGGDDFDGDNKETWREEGFFLTNIDCLAAQSLCEKYQQNAGVIVDRRYPAQLVWHPDVKLPD